MLVENLGEWLNGRVMVSKTTGCVFESRLPCQSSKMPDFKPKMLIFGRFSLFFYSHLSVFIAVLYPNFVPKNSVFCVPKCTQKFKHFLSFYYLYTIPY